MHRFRRSLRPFLVNGPSSGENVPHKESGRAEHQQNQERTKQSADPGHAMKRMLFAALPAGSTIENVFGVTSGPRIVQPEL
jgi:hypothetical protein